MSSREEPPADNAPWPSNRNPAAVTSMVTLVVFIAFAIASFLILARFSLGDGSGAYADETAATAMNTTVEK